MKTILAGFIMDGKSGGVDKYLLQFLDTVWQEGMQIDFLTNEMTEELQKYLEKYHSSLYAVPSLMHPIGQFRQVCRILEEKNYDAVYLNISTAIDCVAAFAAMKMGVPECMIHSHSSGIDGESALKRTVFSVIHRICRKCLYKAGTRFYGCSVKAGEWLFPRKIVHSDRFEVIYNAVDQEKFQYREEIRKEEREKLGIAEDTLVLGHLGNFCYVKNYPFLIDVFEEVHKRHENSVLLLAGTGAEVDEIKALVEGKGLQSAVRFLGWLSDTSRLYPVLDVFLLPSRFEGLPIVGVEAQCSSLTCILSDSISKEAKIQERCYFLPLSEGAGSWAEFILEHRDYDRNSVQMLPEMKHYDLSKQKEQLRGILCH